MNARVADRCNPVIEPRGVTYLSDRDRDRFMALLNDATAGPNASLTKAAESYRASLGLWRLSAGSMPS